MGGCLGKPQKGVSGEVEEEIRLGNDSTQLEIEDSALEQDFSGHGGFREVSDSGRPFPDVTKLHIDDKKPYTSAGTHYTGVGKPPLPKIGHMATNLDKGLVGENVSESMPISMPSPHKQMSAKSFKARRARSSQSSELRRSAEFWEKKDVHSLREADLVDHYHKDSELILRSLGRLHQKLNSGAQSASDRHSADLGRASVTLRATAETSGRDLLRGAAFGSQPSEGLSVCGEEGLVPGLPKKSLKVLLSNDPLILGARQDFDDGRMLGARRKLKTWAKRHGINIAELQEHVRETGIDVEELETHCTVIEKALESHRNEEGYRTARDDGELRVLYKNSNKGKYHCVKMEATLPFPLERPLSLAREFDLMKQWNKYITESERLYAPSIWESYVYAGMWMPFPFPQMEVVGRGRGYDLAEDHKCLLIACESIEVEDLPEGSQPLPKTKRSHHRAEVIPGSSIRLEPLPPLPGDSARTKGTIVMVIDAHVPHVPAFIINWVLGVMAPFAHKQIKTLLQNEFDDPSKLFPKRMAENEYLYNKVRQTVKEGLERHYGPELAAKAVGL